MRSVGKVKVLSHPPPVLPCLSFLLTDEDGDEQWDMDRRVDKGT